MGIEVHVQDHFLARPDLPKELRFLGVSRPVSVIVQGDWAIITGNGINATVEVRTDRSGNLVIADHFHTQAGSFGLARES